MPTPRPKFGHGEKYSFLGPDKKKRQVFGCYHPSQQNTFTGKLTEKMLDAVINDLQAKRNK
jgi:uracil-DNA glycosylase